MAVDCAFRSGVVMEQLQQFVGGHDTVLLIRQQRKRIGHDQDLPDVFRQSLSLGPEWKED
jgi:hypothetical protein